MPVAKQADPADEKSVGTKEGEEQPVTPSAPSAKVTRTSAPSSDEQLVDGQLQFSISRLIADAPKLLEVSKHVAAGALSEVTQSHLTVADAKRRVAAWLSRPVTTA